MAALTQKQRYIRRLSSLKSDRASWESHWRELAEYLLPRRPRWVSSDRNWGGKKNDKIVNSTATEALRTLASGMMAGLTSPARPWFRLATRDPKLMDDGEVRSWLEDCEARMREIFHRSNLYQAFPSIYEDLAAFGTAVMFVDGDEDELLRCYVLPLGTYCLMTSAKGEVNGLYRECVYTVEQVLERWPETASRTVRSQYDAGNYDAQVQIVHVIQPNRGYEEGRADLGGKRWHSCWFELQTGEEELLSEGGYEEFPVLAPRWNVTGEDVYGSSPGMDCLGDIKALQEMEKRKALALEKLVNPVMTGPPGVKSNNPSLLPGSLTVNPDMAGGRYEPAHVVDPRAVLIAEEIGKHENRIERVFYSDLFRMMTDTTRRQITAREVEERHEEKLLLLGQVLERLNDELLDPLIDRTFGLMLRAGLIPPPPEVIQGADLRVEYISIMAQAQKLIGVSQVDRLVMFAANLAALDPAVIQKLNTDQLIDHYADLLGTSTDLVRTADEVGELRAQQAQQQALQQAAQLAQPAQQAAQATKALAETPLDEDSALTRMLPPAAA